MDMVRFALVAIGSGVLMSFSDWLFLGVLFHERYKIYPEVLRRPSGSGEGTPIAIATVFGFLTAAVFALLCYRLHLHGANPFKLAAGIWVAAALPLIVSQALWVKVDPRVSSAHAAGWLVRLMIPAAAVSLFMN